MIELCCVVLHSSPRTKHTKGSIINVCFILCFPLLLHSVLDTFVSPFYGSTRNLPHSRWIDTHTHTHIHIHGERDVYERVCTPNTLSTKRLKSEPKTRLVDSKPLVSFRLGYSHVCRSIRSPSPYDSTNSITGAIAEHPALADQHHPCPTP